MRTTKQSPTGSTDSLFGNLSDLRVHAVGGVLLIFSYVMLDWASYIFPLGPFNITPWNPPPALLIVWMMLGGLAYGLVGFAAAFLADIIIRGAPGGLWVTGLTSFAIAAGYAGVAGILRRIFGANARLSDTKKLWMFVAATVAGAGLVALLYVGVLHATGLVGDDAFVGAVRSYWVGDLVGVLVTAPLLLVAVDPEARERVVRSWVRPVTVLQYLVLLASVTLIFEVAELPIKYFYVLFLPLIWIALSGGLPNAALACGLVQIGVVLCTNGGAAQSVEISELQALVAALTITGLFLGVMSDERERAAEDLRQSLRLAAAGEMAGAIAHELNQPLAAIVNYASACLLILQRGPHTADDHDLVTTIQKTLAEATRAGRVVARLRDFFRTGATKLDDVSLDDLIREVSEIGRGLERSAEVRLSVSSDGVGERLLVDRVQIGLVLRNLLANAYEAALRGGSERRSVSVSAEVSGVDVLIRFVDTGDGVSPPLRGRLFRPFVSGKSTGMGLGLALSQAIVEAHGGSLTAAITAHGEFHLRLPRWRRNDGG